MVDDDTIKVTDFGFAYELKDDEVLTGKCSIRWGSMRRVGAGRGIIGLALAPKRSTSIGKGCHGDARYLKHEAVLGHCMSVLRSHTTRCHHRCLQMGLT